MVSDTTAAAELGALAQEALATHAGQTFAGRRMQRAGDQSFWGIGLPAIFANMGEQPAGGSESAQAAVFGREPRRGNGTGWWWHTPADTLDKIDIELLARDTRIYLHVVSRLLTDAVLPFDFGATAAAMAARLRELHGDALDLTLAIARAERLGALVARLDGEPAWLNEQLRRLSRVLTPLDYCAGDRFGHDPAIFAGGLPALADVPRLAALAPDGAAYHFLRSRLVRERTRVEVGLREAVGLVEAALERAERAVSA